MNQISDPVYSVMEDDSEFAAGLEKWDKGKIRTFWVYCQKEAMLSDLPRVEGWTYYQDNDLTVEEVRLRVSQGRMHPRAIPIIVEMLL